MLRQLGQILSNLQGAPGGVHRRVWEELSPWLGQLAGHAAKNWVPRLAAGNPCQIPLMQNGVAVGPCRGKAIAACLVCGRPVCLSHAFVDKYGEAVCYLCVASSAAGAAPAEPPVDASAAQEAAVAAARRLLRLKRSATLEEARAAWRKLSGKHHPDRFPEAKKAEQEAKFKEIQHAWDVLQVWYAKQAA